MPQMRGSLTIAVRLLKSMPLTALSSLVMLRPKRGDVEAVGLVADAQPALEQLVVAELDRPVEEELDLRAVVPVGEDVDAPRADRMLVARGEIDGPLGRLRQLVAVDRHD